MSIGASTLERTHLRVVEVEDVREVAARQVDEHEQAEGRDHHHDGQLQVVHGRVVHVGVRVAARQWAGRQRVPTARRIKFCALFVLYDGRC